MRLENVKASNNLEDRIGPNRPLNDVFGDIVFRLFYPVLGGLGNTVSPAENDAYVARARKYKKADFNDSIVNYTPEEQKLMREQGFGLDDIHVMRSYKKGRR